MRDKMTHQLKGYLLCKPDDLSLNPGTHMKLRGENQLRKHSPVSGYCGISNLGMHPLAGH